MKKGIKYIYLIGASYLIAIISVIIITATTSILAMFFGIGYFIIFAFQAVALRWQMPAVFNRELKLDQEKGNILVYPILICGIATMAIASTSVVTAATLPYFMQYIGVGLVVIAHFMFMQVSISYPPFAMELFNEEKAKDTEEGSYSLIRHPFALPTILLLLSIPMTFLCAWAFFPAGLGIVFVIAKVSVLDHWRFTNYDWYYDYTIRVSYRLLPFFW